MKVDYAQADIDRYNELIEIIDEEMKRLEKLRLKYILLRREKQRERWKIKDTLLLTRMII